MEPYPSFRDEYDIYFSESRNHFFKYRYQEMNLAGYHSINCTADRHCSHGAERLHFAGILLAPYFGWRTFWNSIRGGFSTDFWGNVCCATKCRTAVNTTLKSVKNVHYTKLL
ncbi:MAG: hypothetical protein KJP06_03960, partial [Deltaproteobacteria bacterium]|nr:hypothetical protein [Deltaproteobacteria bacterium]